MSGAIPVGEDLEPTREPVDAAPIPGTSEADTDGPGDADPGAPGGTGGAPIAVGWWVALGLALAFLVGAAGYVVGTHTTDPAATYGEVDRGFLSDMMSHHDQAVEMAASTQGRATDPIVESFAEEVISFQRWEQGMMTEMLAQAGAPLPSSDPDRITMDWMHMPTPLGVMPGMASPEQLSELEAAQGRELDIMFLELMRDHHEGGIHMALYAAENAENPRVRELAARMARNQRVEVNEYNARLRALGVQVP